MASRINVAAHRTEDLRRILAALASDRGEIERLRAEIINSPETADFMAGVPIEAAHQRERWGADHDAGKSPFDWFWLIGYLSQKAADAAVRGDTEKARHHTISTGAALANWHAHLAGTDTRMRPGIDSARAAISERPVPAETDRSSPAANPNADGVGEVAAQDAGEVKRLRLIARSIKTRMATACDWTRAGKDHVKVRTADWHVLMEIAESARAALGEKAK